MLRGVAIDVRCKTTEVKNKKRVFEWVSRRLKGVGKMNGVIFNSESDYDRLKSRMVLFLGFIFYSFSLFSSSNAAKMAMSGYLLILRRIG